MLLIVFVATLLNGFPAGGTIPWMPSEHRALADSAFRLVISDLGVEAPSFPGPSDPPIGLKTAVWRGMTFGRLVEHLAGDDGAAARFQEAGKTVYEQLSRVSRADVEAYWALVSGRLDPGDPVFPDGENVVANYFLAHLAAMRFARSAASTETDAGPALRSMLVYEAMAQGFLADAHASGHLLVPRHDAFQSLHPVNNRRAHDFYDTEGVFVVNGRYEVWEAFGDGLLSWYARSYRQVLEACATSLREVFVVYYVSGGSVPDGLRGWFESMADRPLDELAAQWTSGKDGATCYEGEERLPGLDFIPMPISATWSMRGEATDKHGIRIRRQYPQFREQGYHDPGLLDAARDQLYSKSSFPARFIPPSLRDASNPAVAAQGNRDAASVEFVQIHELTPSFAGLLLETGAGVLADDEGSAPALSARIGYGLADDILVASRVSVNAGLTISMEGDQPTPATLIAGFNPGALPIRIETGYATTTEDFTSESAWVIAAAYDLTSRSLGFTYVGVSVRLRYGIMLFDELLHSASIQLAFY